MGYLNNTTRVLDAILTKKGREILSSGGSGGLGSFEVTKFALGDDEIDYQLWDTTHTQGSTYYGAVLDNLPALEPFNDPSEIMKYKLVTRTENTEAMARLRDRHQEEEPHWQATLAKTTANTDSTGLNWFANKQGGVDSNRVRVRLFTDDRHEGHPASVGRGKAFGVQHLDNSDYGAVDFLDYVEEGFTITVLDSTVAFLAPSELDSGGGQNSPDYRYYIKSEDEPNQRLWHPFVTSVQHVSQTIRNCQVVDGTFHKHVYNPDSGWSNGNWRIGDREVSIYPKRIASNNSPAKTSILITGETSGATFEYDVTVTYSPNAG
jgi:hypothetical protein